MSDLVVPVNTAVLYGVHIGEGLLARAGMLIGSVVRPLRVMLVTDDNVSGLYGETVCKSLEGAGFEVFKHVIAHGEESKTLGTLFEIVEDAADKRLTRKDLFVALGGGVVGDITGFAASVYMRGADFVQMPTTLLAAVDASVGGKTAVDLKHGKNLAGTFWQPRMVLCDTDVIRDLPDSLFANGMGEVIKHGFIAGNDILETIGRGDEKRDIERFIKRNIEIKRDVVEADERESGRRMVLNFGHTVAHAIEKTSGYQIPHGIAVGTGMVYETRLAQRLGICQKGLAERVKGYCDLYGLFAGQEMNADFFDAMLHDKKNSEGKLVFALPERVGAFRIVKLTPDEVERYMYDICGDIK